MNKKTATALDRSIAHWDRFAAGTARKNEDIGADDCPLCTLFHKNARGCEGCPVEERTRRNYCQGSPFLAALRAGLTEKGFASPRFQAAAAKMRDFLISLREDGE